MVLWLGFWGYGFRVNVFGLGFLSCFWFRFLWLGLCG